MGGRIPCHVRLQDGKPSHTTIQKCPDLFFEYHCIWPHGQPKSIKIRPKNQCFRSNTGNFQCPIRLVRDNHRRNNEESAPPSSEVTALATEDATSTPCQAHRSQNGSEKWVVSYVYVPSHGHSSTFNTSSTSMRWRKFQK